MLHSHSEKAVLISYLFDKEVTFTRFEMIKGLVRHGGDKSESMEYYDTVVVPIIENTSREADLTDALQGAVEKYPECTAVIVRGHGVYIWGPTWEKAKTSAECYDYLFSITIEMKKLGIVQPHLREGSA